MARHSIHHSSFIIQHSSLILYQVDNHIEGFVVDELFLRFGVAWGEAGEVDVLEDLHDGLMLEVGDMLFEEAAVDGVAVEL